MRDEAFQTAAQVEEAYGVPLATAETVRGGLLEVTRHMYRRLQRSAFSNAVREVLDFAVCVHMPTEEGTQLVAVTEGCTHFAPCHAHMTNFVMDEWGLDTLGPGDTLVCNDPWRGAIHLPDISLFRPVFWEGELVFILSDATHLMDIGGAMAGGFNNAATEFFAEGVRIPPMLITSGDVPVRSTMNLILENSRTPQHNLGDLRALFGTMKVGESRLHRLFERYGRDAVLAASQYTLDLAHRRMARAISEVPDGVYEAEEWIDDDGVSDTPLRLHAVARVAGSHVEVDFSGTDRQPLGALTTCWMETGRFLIGAKMLLDPAHPLNSGMLRPFHLVAATGSLIMGTPPTSCSQHSEVGTAIASLSEKIFSQLAPRRAIAVDGGTSGALIVSGVDHREGREGLPFGFVVMGGIGWGGTSTGDGISFCTTPVFGISCPTYELMERDGPLIIRGVSAVIDTAGGGRYRAGFQNSLLLEFTGPATVAVIMDSGRFTRPGVAGGGDGMTSYMFRVIREPDGRIPMADGLVPLDHLEPLAGKFGGDGRPDPVNGEWASTEFATLKPNIEVAAGEVLLLVPASGGGYGDPLTRDPSLVERDVWNERVSVGGAARVYGVVVDPANLSVDADATDQTRAVLGRDRDLSGEVPVSIHHPWPRTVAELRNVGKVVA